MSTISDYGDIKERYLDKIACELEGHLLYLLRDEDVSRIDRVSVRAKSTESFLKKAAKKDKLGNSKYVEPITEIQDQIGARITVFFQSDVDIVCTKIVKRCFTAIESTDKIPATDSEFGYFGKHFILLLPSEVLPSTVSDAHKLPRFFELQIKTLFQHAWSEANHDIGYKAVDRYEPKDLRRRLAFASAQAWGADRIFDEIFKEIADYQQYNFNKKEE